MENNFNGNAVSGINNFIVTVHIVSHLNKMLSDEFDFENNITSKYNE